jgi:uncharacterized protein YdhG (YjbR/CyaY superfamily)
VRQCTHRAAARRGRWHDVGVSRQEIDDYLANIAEPERAALEHLRTEILRVVPDAEECISYRMPAFRVQGGVVAGFAAFPHHLSYLPFSGSVVGTLGDELAGFGGTKSSIHFTAAAPLPDPLVQRLVEVRLEEIRARRRR